MIKTKDVKYVVDEKGRRKAVILSYKAFQELLEDLEDLQVIAERRNEPADDLESVIKDLKDAGRV